MSYKPRWDNGGWNVICDACGRKFKEHELQLRWDGLMVCRGDWEPRHPQDFVKGVADIQAPKYARPEQQDYFIPMLFDKDFPETIDVTENLVKLATKKFGGGTSAVTSALNGTYLNALSVNQTTTTGVDPERVLLSETILLALGRGVSDTMSVSETVVRRVTKNISDTISIAESLQLIEVERTVESLSLSEALAKGVTRVSTDTLSISESVTTKLISPTALNGAALNSFGLD